MIASLLVQCGSAARARQLRDELLARLPDCRAAAVAWTDSDPREARLAPGYWVLAVGRAGAALESVLGDLEEPAEWRLWGEAPGADCSCTRVAALAPHLES